jgi:hypothetical protein
MSTFRTPFTHLCNSDTSCDTDHKLPLKGLSHSTFRQNLPDHIGFRSEKHQVGCFGALHVLSAEDLNDIRIKDSTEISSGFISLHACDEFVRHSMRELCDGEGGLCSAVRGFRCQAVGGGVHDAVEDARDNGNAHGATE